MKKTNLLLLALILPFLLMSQGCMQQIIARMTGVIGTGATGIYADIGFDGFNYNSSGSGSAFQLILKFDNLGGEYIEFTLAPANPSGTGLSGMYPPAIYSINGTTNKCEGRVAVGTGFMNLTSTMGEFVIDILNFTGGQITAIQGSFSINPEVGGNLEGTFSWQM